MKESTPEIAPAPDAAHVRCLTVDETDATVIEIALRALAPVDARAQQLLRRVRWQPAA